MRRLLALAVGLALMLALLAGRAAAADERSAAEAARHQVLVMLRLPPPHFHADGAYGGGYNEDSGGGARRRLARELAAAHGLRLRENWSMPAIGVDCFLMEETDGTPLARVLDALAHDARVVWAQPIADYEALGTADPLYPIQPAAHDWRLAELHRVSTGRNVQVAVIDSGVDAAHPDLAGQFVLRRNFVDGMPDAAEAHGTAVAGVIAAHSGNGLGIAGIAPGARIMALRACWEAGASRRAATASRWPRRSTSRSRTAPTSSTSVSAARPTACCKAWSMRRWRAASS